MPEVVRTQIYLTEDQQRHLRSLASRTGRKQSELIREAIDQYVESSSAVDYRALVKRGYGLWRDRDDLPDFGSLRGEFDRYSRE